MASDLWGQRAQSRGVVWRDLGVALPDDIRTVSDAMRYAHADYPIVPVPQYFTSPTDGTMCKSEQVALVRPTWDDSPEHVLGYVSGKYTLLQNAELGEMLDPLTEYWPVDSIGVRHYGAELFVTLDAGEKVIGGDQMRQYFIIWENHDGTGSLRINVTTIRLACFNAMQTGLKHATIMATVRHTGRVKDEAAFAINLVAQLRQAESKSLIALDNLTKVKFSGREIASAFNKVMDATYPLKELNVRGQVLESAGSDVLTPEQKLRLDLLKAQNAAEHSKALALRLLALERFRAFNDNYPKFANTAWAIFNGVTESATWREGGSEANIEMSILQGSRGAEMARAYTALSRMS